MSTERRSLQFENLDQLKQEIDRLLAGGYTKTGNWNLSQVCAHLHDWMRFSMDGYPKAPAPIRLMLWLMKVTVGRRQFESVLSSGFKDRLPTMPQTVPDADRASDAESVKRLTDTVNRFQAYSGPIVASPLYGPLTRDEALKLQLAHCAHHLSFLNPKV